MQEQTKSAKSVNIPHHDLPSSILTVPLDPKSSNVWQDVCRNGLPARPGCI